MKAYNTTSYRFLFVVASRGIEPYLKFRETSIHPLNYKDYKRFCKDNGSFVDLTRIKNKVPSPSQTFQIFSVNRA